MSSFTIRLRFHGDLPFFLGSKISTVERRLSEKTSVKDVIEFFTGDLIPDKDAR